MTAAYRLAEAGVARRAVRARRRSRRARRRVRLRRAPRRSLLPRDPPDATTASAASPTSSASATGSASGRRGVGFYDDGRLFSMSSVREFADASRSWPPHDRVRLAAFVARCQLITSRASSTRRRCCTGCARTVRPPDGRTAVEAAARLQVRRPLRRPARDLHLGAHAADVEDARHSGPRDHGLARGRLRDADRRARRAHPRARRRDPRRHARSIRSPARRTGADGLVVDGQLRPFDHVLCTLLPPLRATAARCRRSPSRSPTDHCRYLGVICVLAADVAQRQPVLHAQHHRPADSADDGRRDDARRRPRSTSAGTCSTSRSTSIPSHPDLKRPDDEVAARLPRPRARDLPRRSRDDEILDVVVQRAPRVEPVHTLGGATRLPRMFPVPGLALASTAHVYPEIVNGQAVIGVADRVRSRDPRAPARRTQRRLHDLGSASGSGALASLRSAVATDRGRARCARRSLFVALAVVTLGRPGATSARTRATTCSQARGSRTASCRTSTSSTTTARSPRSCSGSQRGSAARVSEPAIAVGLAISCAIVGLTYALARTYCEPLPAALAAAIVAGRRLRADQPQFRPPAHRIGDLRDRVPPALRARPRPVRRRWLGSLARRCGNRRRPRGTDEAGSRARVRRRDDRLARSATAGLSLDAPGVRAPGSTCRRDSRTGLRRVPDADLVPPAGLREPLPGRRPAGRRQPRHPAARAAHRVVVRAPRLPRSRVRGRRRGSRRGRCAAREAEVAAGCRRCVVAALVCVVALLRPETTRYYLGYAYEWIPIGAPLLLAYCIFRGQRATVVAELAVLCRAGGR